MQTDVNFQLLKCRKCNFHCCRLSLCYLVTILSIEWERERNKTQNFKLNLYCSHLYTVRILTIISRVQYNRINAIDKIIYKMWDLYALSNINSNAFSCTHEFLSKSALSLYLSLSLSLSFCLRACVNLYLLIGIKSNFKLKLN